MTGQIIAGGSDPWHGGIRPVDLLWLSEGVTTSLVLGTPEDPESIVWETVPGQIFDTAILMLALLGIRDPDLRARAEGEAPELLTHGPVRLPELERGATRDLVDQASVVVSRSMKLIVTILSGSSLRSEAGRLARHPGAIEICRTGDSEGGPGKVDAGNRGPSAPHPGSNFGA